MKPRGVPPFEPIGRPSGRTAIVVLGTRDDPARTREALRVFELIDPELVIVSGGLRTPVPGELPAAHHVRRALIEAGVPASRIIVEDQSRTTRDQARLVAPMLQRERVTTTILVTADLHMRRAAGAFRRMGIDPVAAPASGSTASAVHEAVGLLYYFVRGWLR